MKKCDERNKEILMYSLGALLYMPAINKNIAEIIYTQKYAGLKSVCLCLEDSISDTSVEAAEQNVVEVFRLLEAQILENKGLEREFPLIFIRVRVAEQMLDLYDRIASPLLSGFIMPKFDLDNAQEYKAAAVEINKKSSNTVYVMPIIESRTVAAPNERVKILTELKSVIDSISDYVLNIRVGGNDFCNVFGIRRGVDETIYDIGVIRDILSDIYGVFGTEYVVSAPVWEYFDGNGSVEWREGLENELRLDRLNGFIGKTAIHPSQVAVINNSLMVDYADFLDACSILNWNDKKRGVAKGKLNCRMNEVKVHRRWAYKTTILASIYGVKAKESAVNSKTAAAR